MLRDVAPFDRSKLKVQGDARPHSVGTVTLRATLRIAHVRQLTLPLKMNAKRKWWLTDQIYGVMADYLGRILQAERVADHATTLDLMPRIAANCATLADQIDKLDGAVLRLIESNRWEDGDDDNVPLFETLPLVRKLRRLGRAIERTHADMTENPEGRPPKTLLDQTVAKLVDVIEASGCPVKLLNSGSAEPRRQVQQTGGELLKAIFRTFDPHIDEPQIWGAVDRVRRMARAEAEAASEPAAKLA